MSLLPGKLQTRTYSLTAQSSDLKLEIDNGLRCNNQLTITPVAVYSLEVPCGGILVPAGADFPATVSRIQPSIILHYLVQSCPAAVILSSRAVADQTIVPYYYGRH